jgi:hypothetical protein
MIQRIQSVWLLLAAIFAAITFSVPFYVGAMTDVAGLSATTQLTAKTNLLLTTLTVLSGATAFGAIFLFENRKLQLKVSILGILFTILLLVVYILQLKNFTSGSFALSCVIHFGIMAFYILAIRGIRKDEKLIKSLDRLR